MKCVILSLFCRISSPLLVLRHTFPMLDHNFTIIDSTFPILDHTFPMLDHSCAVLSNLFLIGKLNNIVT